MGKSITPKHAVHVEVARTLAGALGAGPVGLTPLAWSNREHGRPTAENLAAFVATYNASFEPGGANAHVGLRIVRAELRVNERGGRVVATWEPDGWYVMGSHTSAAWFKTREEAEAEAKRMNYRGGTHYTVEPSHHRAPFCGGVNCVSPECSRHAWNNPASGSV